MKARGSERRYWVGHCWGTDTARLFFGPDFLYEAYIRDGSQAGLHAAVALVTYSNEARVSTDTSKISLFYFLTLSHYFPSLLQTLFILHFPLFIHSFSWTNPDHRHAADVTVAIVTEASQQRSCAERMNSGGKVTMGHWGKNIQALFTCLGMHKHVCKTACACGMFFQSVLSEYISHTHGMQRICS